MRTMRTLADASKRFVLVALAGLPLLAGCDSEPPILTVSDAVAKPAAPAAPQSPIPAAPIPVLVAPTAPKAPLPTAPQLTAPVAPKAFIPAAPQPLTPKAPRLPSGGSPGSLDTPVAPAPPPPPPPPSVPSIPSGKSPLVAAPVPMPAPRRPDTVQAIQQFESALSRQAWEDLLLAAAAKPNDADSKVVLTIQRILQASIQRDQPDPAAKANPQLTFQIASATQVKEMLALHSLSGEIAWRVLAAMAKSEFDRSVTWYACQIGSGLSASRYEQLRKDLAGRADLQDVFTNAPNRWQGANNLNSSGGPPWP